MGIGKETINKTCENCMRQQYCERKGKVCREHKSFRQKLDNLQITLKEWDKFTEEWDLATMAVRKRFGYGSRTR